MYVGDTKSGQVNGEGKDKTWYVVSSKGDLVKKAVASSGSGTTTTKKSAWG